MLKYFRNLINTVQVEVNNKLSSFSGVVKQIILFFVTLIILVWLAIFFYGTFYYYYVPVVFHEKPVYFHFRVCDTGIGMCSFPQANISLTQEGHTEVFKRGQPYKIVLDIDLPESEINRNLGMFMVEMMLYNKTGVTVHTSSRTACLHYKSELLHILETLAFAPFFLFGYMDQKQTVHVEMFPHFIDNSYNPAVGAVVEVQSMKLELYTVNLKVFAQFSGIRYFLYYWPITSAAIGICWTFVLLSFITVLSWYQFLLPKKQSNNNQVVKVNLPGKKKIERPPRKGIEGSVDEGAETVGGVHDLEETTLLSAASPGAREGGGLRLRQSRSPQS